MGVCPTCEGTDAVRLEDDTFECRTPRVVAAATPGMSGKTAVPQPLYDVCGTRYTAAAAEQAAKTMYERHRRQAEESARLVQAKRDEEKRLRESVEPNRERIGQLAALLIQAHPQVSRAVVRLAAFEVPVKGWLRTRDYTMHGWIEVDRAWPIGEVGITEPGPYHTERLEYREAGALPTGRIVWLRGGQKNELAGPAVGLPEPAEYELIQDVADDDRDHGITRRPEQLEELRLSLEEQHTTGEVPEARPEIQSPPPFSRFPRTEYARHLGPSYVSKRPGHLSGG